MEGWGYFRSGNTRASVVAFSTCSGRTDRPAGRSVKGQCGFAARRAANHGSLEGALGRLLLRESLAPYDPSRHLPCHASCSSSCRRLGDSNAVVASCDQSVRGEESRENAVKTVSPSHVHVWDLFRTYSDRLVCQSDRLDMLEATDPKVNRLRRSRIIPLAVRCLLTFAPNRIRQSAT